MSSQNTKGSKTWEEYLTLGMEAREDKDNSQWKLGDLASDIVTSYGEDTIGKYAYAIKVEKKTLMNYKAVAKKFEPSLRKKYPRLSFSHFSTLVNTEKPQAWLTKAEDEDWNVETLRHKVKEAYPSQTAPDTSKPPEVYKCPECGLWRLKGVSSYDICRGHYEITKDGMTYK